MTPERFRPVVVVVALLIVVSIGGMLTWAIWALPAKALGLSALVQQKLPESGVDAEVTAILLNFRGYDTLLELAVLAAALMSVWHLGVIQVPRQKQQPGAVLETLIRYLVPVIVLITGYVLWLGSHASGGAFQAGALLAGAGVLLFVVQPEALALRDGQKLRALLIAGPALFVLVAAGVMFTGGPLLEYPPQSAGTLILLIESASTLSIGMILLMLFAGGRPGPGGER